MIYERIIRFLTSFNGEHIYDERQKQNKYYTYLNSQKKDEETIMKEK